MTSCRYRYLYVLNSLKILDIKMEKLSMLDLIFSLCKLSACNVILTFTYSFAVNPHRHIQSYRQPISSGAKVLP